MSRNCTGKPSMGCGGAISIDLWLRLAGAFPGGAALAVEIGHRNKVDD